MKRLALMCVMLLLTTFVNAGLGIVNNHPTDFRLAPIDDPLRVTFFDDSTGLGTQRIKGAIAFGATAKDWKVLRELDGRTELTTTVRGKHVVHIIVVYDNASYEIRYLDSVNLMYEEQRENNRTQRLIHKNYNVWIRDLAAAINSKIGEPAKTTAGTAPQMKEQAKVSIAHRRPVPPASGFAAVDDIGAVPVRLAGKDRYQHYLSLPSPKAFVVTDKGGWHLWYGNPDVMTTALDYCEQQTVGCWLYAVDDKVIWHADPDKRFSRVEQVVKNPS